MEILWPALGISVIVVFVFFILAQHWQRTLRHHSWTIRRLTERMRDLEELGDPEFRRRLSENLPSPLEQVIHFSFRLDNRFWKETLRLTAEDMDYVRAFGSILGAVKLEQWRGRTVATVTEVLPESKAAGWQSRTLDFYSGEAHRGDPLTLWEVPLAPPRESLAHPPALALSLRGDFLELRAGLRNGTGAGHGANPAEDQETVFFRVPLDAARLAEFRSADPVSNGNGGSLNGNSWQSFYSHEDSDLGIDWQLRLRDLQRQSEWEQWKILEPAQMDETAAQGECGLTGSPAQTFSNPSISRSTA